MFVSPAPFDPITKICGCGAAAALWDGDESATGTRAIDAVTTTSARGPSRDIGWTIPRLRRITYTGPSTAEDLGQLGRVDVAAGDDADDLAAARGSASGERDRGGAGALRDDPRALGEQANGVRHLLETRDERAVEELSCQLEHFREDLGRADPVDEARRVVDVHRPSDLERGRERGGGSDLGREDLAHRRERADRGRDPTGEPAASVRRDDRVDLGQVLEDLERDRAISGHDRVVAEGVHVKAVEALKRTRAEDLVPLVERDRDHVGTQAPDRRDLGLGSRVRKDHGAVHPEPLRPPRDALRHVSGARGPHAVLELFGRGEQERVARAAQLEGADRLEVLELEVDLRRRVLELEADERRADDRAGQALAGSFDLGQRDHKATAVPTPSSSARR